MKNNPYKGKHIVFEGLDGAGSSTQVNILVNRLKKEKIKCFYTKEPTNGIIGGLIRGSLTEDWKVSDECLQLLFAADRINHLEKEVIPILKRGNTIISDRYFFSNIAFGSISLDKNWLIALNKNIIYPDLTFLIQVSAKECIRRIKKDRFGFELFEEKNKLEKAWKTYQYLAKKYKNVYIIDGTKSIDKISKEIFNITKKVLKI